MKTTVKLSPPASLAFSLPVPLPEPIQAGKVAAHIPRATYRVQFQEKFPLRSGLALIPYLHELGISHLYASPLLLARPHSTHGYDTCDFGRLNPELGTEADLEELVKALRAHDMGLIVDIVPNHMGVGGPENRWWWDVLEHGPDSRFSRCFDIDWRSNDPRNHGKVVLPVLGELYHRALEKGDIKLELHDGEPRVRYFDNTFPLNARSRKLLKDGLEKFNTSPEAMDALLQQQYYRLTWWTHGDSELNYRRFFNISGLAALAIEDEHVFDQVMGLVAQWLKKGWVDGLRVDHPDGLRDPEQFFQRLHALAPDAWIVLEKILDPDELLPAAWPVAGTTGYDFLNHAGGLFVDHAGAKPLFQVYSAFCGNTLEYGALACEKRRLVLHTLLAAETARVTGLLLRAAASSWRHRDYARTEWSAALVEYLACFPVYRSYVQPRGGGEVKESDAALITQAFAEARRRRPDLPVELFEFLRDLLLLQRRGETESEFVSRFQPLSASAMAKGVEDTVFYCFNCFVALNEVGGNPGRFGGTVDGFHQFCRRRHANWPAGQLTTSTHDTKRSEDVRSRLSLLSEIPAAWRDAVNRWSDLNERHRGSGLEREAEYLYYQTLVGAWPLPEARALSYMEKAAYEAKEKAGGANLREFVTATYADPKFMADLTAFVQTLLVPSYVNSLALTLLKLTAPGVPDIYQGAELWDLSLVDPDNRREVDFTLRQQLIAKAAALSAEEAWRECHSGLPKLWLTRRVLQLRARRPDWFSITAGYEPLVARGHASDHVVAFRRGDHLITVVLRLVITLNNDWRDTAIEIPPGDWRNELTGEPCPSGKVLLADLLKRFPVALLTREERV